MFLCFCVLVIAWGMAGSKVFEANGLMTNVFTKTNFACVDVLNKVFKRLQRGYNVEKVDYMSENHQFAEVSEVVLANAAFAINGYFTVIPSVKGKNQFGKYNFKAADKMHPNNGMLQACKTSERIKRGLSLYLNCASAGLVNCEVDMLVAANYSKLDQFPCAERFIRRVGDSMFRLIFDFNLFGRDVKRWPTSMLHRKCVVNIEGIMSRQVCEVDYTFFQNGVGCYSPAKTWETGFQYFTDKSIVKHRFAAKNLFEHIETTQQQRDVIKVEILEKRREIAQLQMMDSALRKKFDEEKLKQDRLRLENLERNNDFMIISQLNDRKKAQNEQRKANEKQSKDAEM